MIILLINIIYMYQENYKYKLLNYFNLMDYYFLVWANILKISLEPVLKEVSDIIML